MNFLETFFGISPDGGSGLTEALLLLVLVALFAAIALMSNRSHSYRSATSGSTRAARRAGM